MDNNSKVEKDIIDLLGKERASYEDIAKLETQKRTNKILIASGIIYLIFFGILTFFIIGSIFTGVMKLNNQFSVILSMIITVIIAIFIVNKIIERVKNNE